MNNPLTIFLTGGTGFIGSHFINLAHDHGIQIIAHRRSKDSRPRINLNTEPCWIEGELDQITSADLNGCQAIVHLAAHSANVPYDSFENCLLENVIKPLRLFQNAHAIGIKRIIVAGSCFEYGDAANHYDFVPASAALEPSASYPASKAAASIAFMALAKQLNLSLSILRIFQVYGEGELESRFWPSLRRAAKEGKDFSMSLGLQVRDFTPVGLVAQAFVDELMGPPEADGKPHVRNIGTGMPMSLGDFAQREWQAFQASGKLILGAVPMRPEEVMRLVPQIT